MDQMNENLERLRALEAENKDLLNKLETIATTTTPPRGFGHANQSPTQSYPPYESVGSTKYGSRCPSDWTSSQHAIDT
ncbi:hypothetical protein ACOSQ2_002820 [Xanthoceras sorbifolium]